jgi:23S rRNA (pseudouridine1915-N3)-methyltransferase
MKMTFILCWPEKSRKAARQRLPFKEELCQALFSEYLEKTRKFSEVNVKVMAREELGELKGSLWLCDTSKAAKMLTSVALAERLEKTQVGGFSEINVVVGPHDGFRDEDRKRASLLWSFGPLTLPHELAAIIAAEQIYRAWTILRRHPYHLGH